MAIFPSADASTSDLLVAANLAKTNLNGAISVTTDPVSIQVVSTSLFGTAGTITIDTEIIKYTSIDATHFNVPAGGRGYEGTTPATHLDATQVSGKDTAAYHNLLANEIVAIEAELGTNPKGSSASVSARLATLLAASTPITVTSVNGNTITTSSGTLTLAAGKTVAFADAFTTVGGAISITAPSGATVTLPVSGTLATLDGSETLIHKTITSSTNFLGGVSMSLGSDTTGDIYYRDSSGHLNRIGIGSGSTILKVGGTGIPAWTTATLTDASGTIPLVTTAGGSITFTGPTAARAFALPDANATFLTASTSGTIGQALISGGSGGPPTWYAPTVTQVLYAGIGGILSSSGDITFASNTLSLGSATGSGAINLYGATSSYTKLIGPATGTATIVTLPVSGTLAALNLASQIFTEAITIRKAATPQLTLSYGTGLDTFLSTAATTGHFTIAPQTVGANIVLTPNGAGSVVLPIIAPPADSTEAIKITKVDGSTSVITVDSSNVRLGIGTAHTTLPLATVHSLSTTEQLRIGYDWATNYTSFTVGSAGSLTINPKGSTPDFILKQNSSSAVNVITSIDSGAVVNTLYLNAGKVGFGITSPTALAHFKAGTATAGTAPIKLTSGTNLTTPEAGAIEFDGTYLTYTTNAAIRNKLASLATSVSANYGTLSVGGGPFDGSASGHFVGSSSGTSIAVNEVSAYAGNLIDLQVAGVSKFKIAGSINGNITLSPTGTGSVISSKGFIGPTIDASSYGFSTSASDVNNTTYLNAAIAAAQSSGVGTVYMPSGYYRFSGTINITNGVTLRGAGMLNTVLAKTDVSAGISINKGSNNLYSVVLDGFTLFTDSNSQIAAEGITVTSTASSQNDRFINLYISHFSNGIHFYRAAYWSIDKCVIVSNSSAGIYIENRNSPDEGDSMISNTQTNSNTYGVYYQNSGGLKYVNNKSLGDTYGMYVGFDGQTNITGTPSNSGDLFISNSSFEGGNTCIYLTTIHYTFGSITIVGNELQGSNIGLHMDSGINFTSIMGNVINAATGIDIGSGPSNILVGLNNYTCTTNILDPNNIIFQGQYEIIPSVTSYLGPSSPFTGLPIGAMYYDRSSSPTSGHRLWIYEGGGIWKSAIFS